ncbi:MAG: hypothetical protein AAFU85_28740 [Planctomycetota bacterium]
MNRRRFHRFSLRTTLIATAVAASLFYGVNWYNDYLSDYGEPDASWWMTHNKELSTQEISNRKKGAAYYVEALKRDFPAKDRSHWQNAAKQLRPGMTEVALRKHLPAASWQTSWAFGFDDDYDHYGISSDEEYERALVQVFIYPLDSRFALCCEMRTPVVTEPIQQRPCTRVHQVLGIFEHDLELDDFGALQVADVKLMNDKATIEFGIATNQ